MLDALQKLDVRIDTRDFPTAGGAGEGAFRRRRWTCSSATRAPRSGR
jgi:hypothetical protein